MHSKVAWTTISALLLSAAVSTAAMTIKDIRLTTCSGKGDRRPITGNGTISMGSGEIPPCEPRVILCAGEWRIWMDRLRTELVDGGVTVLKGYESDDTFWIPFGEALGSGALVGTLHDREGRRPAMLIVVQSGTWEFEEKTDYRITFSIIPSEFPEMPR